jgi:hypothetical protein
MREKLLSHFGRKNKTEQRRVRRAGNAKVGSTSYEVHDRSTPYKVKKRKEQNEGAE